MKQRLVGAAVLVALAVIFLPMLVDGPEPTPGSATVPLDLPAPPERDFETRELPLAPAATPAVAAAAAGDQVVTVETNAPLRPDALPEDLAPATPDTNASEETATAPAVTSAPAAPATAATVPPASAAAAPAATSGGGYAVNLGSYGNAANATALVASLKAAALPAYVEATTLDGKPVQRVRLGPYAQRGEAEASRLAVARLRSDLPAAVVALDIGGTAAPAPVRAAVAAGFAVQIGALKTEADANLLRERARAAGFTTYVERTTTDAGPLWRVRVGPELQRASADRLKTAIAQKLQIDGMVVSHP